MNFFNFSVPIIRPKQKTLDCRGRPGILWLQLRLRDKTLYCNFYTCVDQVFVIWGLISAAIFIIAQFAPISWVTQAIIWSILSAIGIITMVILTRFWVKIERLRWVLYIWVFLMLNGVLLTDLSIFLGWGPILLHLPHLWLGLCALGYLGTGLGMRSRALIIAGTIHLLAIAALPYLLGWQFLATGLVMAANLLIFAEYQWDMRPSLEKYDLSNAGEMPFNRKSYQMPQASS